MAIAGYKTAEKTNKSNTSAEEIMEKQWQDRQQEKEYDNVTGLGWKNFGIAFLVIVIAVVTYTVFCN